MLTVIIYNLLNKNVHHSRFSYHQRIATGLQRRQADTKDYHSWKCVIVDETTAVGISMATIEGHVSVCVARKEDRAEVDLEGDGLHPTVHTDIPLRCKTHTQTQVHTGIKISHMTLGLKMLFRWNHCNYYLLFWSGFMEEVHFWDGSLKP